MFSFEMVLKSVVGAVIGWVNMEEDELSEGGSSGGGRGGGGGWWWLGTVAGDGVATVTTVEPPLVSEDSKVTWEAEELGIIVLAASLYLYFMISALTVLISDCKFWTCCCKAEIAPIHP